MSRCVLLITFHFPPSAASGSFRMLGFAEHLPALGWDVAVVSCADYPYEPADPGLRDRVPPCVAVHAIEYPKLGRSRLSPSRLCRRMGIWDEGSAWSRAVWPVIVKVIDECPPQAVLTSGPPHSIHLLGRRLKRLTGIAWAADFRDPWVAGRWKVPAPNILERRAERSVVAEADLVIINAPKATQAFREYYPEWSRKLITITNGYDASPGRSGNPCVNGPIRMLHTGEVYMGRDPRPLLDAVSRSKTDGEPIELDFLGRVEGIDLKEEARLRGLESRVRSKGHVSSTETRQAIDEANILLLMDAPGRRVGVPAKLYEYIGSGRPILALAECDSDTAWALEESGVPYALAPPQNVDAIAEAVTEVVALASAPSKELPAQARPFTRANLAAELSRHLDQLLVSSGVRPLPAVHSNRELKRELGIVSPDVATAANRAL